MNKEAIWANINEEVNCLMIEMGYLKACYLNDFDVSKLCREDNDYRKFNLFTDDHQDFENCIQALQTNDQRALSNYLVQIFYKNHNDPRLVCRVCKELWSLHHNAECRKLSTINYEKTGNPRNIQRTLDGLQLP